MAEITIDAIRKQDLRQVARLISLIERQDPQRVALLRALHESTGRAHVIGITGPPGSGKSTLTDKLISQSRQLGRRVAVLAIDPSSPFTGGAILGDRIRMTRHSEDEGVFIRSLASRGHLGGLSSATSECVRAFDAAGYDDIIIETVGVGQSEVDIVRCADTVVLVAVPGLGDDIQAIKAGVMEIGDVFCVNKADRDGAERVVRETKAMLETAALNGANTRFSGLYQAAAALDAAAAPVDVRPEGDQMAGTQNQVAGVTHHVARLVDPHHAHLRIPAVLPTIAETGQGVAELYREIKDHYQLLTRTGHLGEHRRTNTLWELRNAVADRLLSWLDQAEIRESLGSMAARIVDKELDFHRVVEDFTSARLAEPQGGRSQGGTA